MLQMNMTNITNDTVLSATFAPAVQINDYINSNVPYMRIVTASLAVLTNVLVVITVAKSRKSWKYSTHILILTLAGVDIAFNSLVLVGEISRHIPVDNIIYKLTWVVCFALLGISDYMMILISLNRYALVCKPFSHHRITSRRSVLKQIIAMSTILTLLGLLHLVNISHMQVCTTLIRDVVVTEVLSHIVPLTVSVVLTILVIREFRKNRSTLNESMNTQTERQGEKNITKAMIAVNVAFVLLTIPHIITSTVHMYQYCLFGYNIMNSYKTVYRVLLTWRDINFSVNIFIYAAYVPKFRAALSSLIKSKCRDKNNGRRNPCAGNQTQNIIRNLNINITQL